MEKSVSKLELVYGNSVHASIGFAGNARLEVGTHSETLAELESAVASALREPLDFPPVEQAIVPGDRVVLAVDPAVPRLADVVLATLTYFESKGIPSRQFTVVMACHPQANTEELARRLPEDVALELHNADDSSKVAYVAANKEGDPIYMNRLLVDADVVLPIMCSRSHSAIDYEGAYGLFPLLTDRQTRGRFHNLRRLADPNEHSRLTSWADEAAWWVGLLVSMQIVPAPDGGIGRVLAGSPQSLEQAAQAAMRQIWSGPIDQTFEVVVALIDGGPSQQSWDSVARILASASTMVSSDGAVILFTELSEKPGPALRKLKSPNRSEVELARQLSSETSDDALAAALLLEMLETNHVFLFSQLSSGVVESLGMGAIETLHQAEHIIQQYDSCLVIGSAQHRIFARNTTF